MRASHSVRISGRTATRCMGAACGVKAADGSFQGHDEGPGTFLSSRAFRIQATAPLVAYQFNPMAQTFSNDASLLLPTNGLGTIHRVLGWPTSNAIAPPPPLTAPQGIPD